jgi:flagellar motor switch protein FliN/FliY
MTMDPSSTLEAASEAATSKDNAVELESAELVSGLGATWDRRMARLRDVPLRVTVQIGSTRMPIGSVLDLHVGQVIELDRQVGAPVDIVANDEVVIARGEVVEVDDEYGVRITEIVPGALT